MVRINLLNPSKLTDQHLIAEYNEILMLFGYVRKYPQKYEMNHDYCLGKGHVCFFKDKLKYLKLRHESIKKEMKKRGFQRRKTINLQEFPLALRKNWRPKKEDYQLIKKRLRQKIKLKPNFYRYYGSKRTKQFFLDLLN